MKSGMTLQQLASELKRQNDNKHDYVAPSTELEMQVGPLTKHVNIRVNGHGSYPLTDVAHSQVAQRLGVPQKYYDRMKTVAPTLLADNVNHWLQHEPEKRMVRTLDGKMRAMLSIRYRPLDNHPLAKMALETLAPMPGLKIESAMVTETRLYIKAVTSRITADVKVGDTVQAGIVISNSEVGLGSVRVEPLVFRLICSNGAIINDAAIKRHHIGRNNEVETAERFYLNETRQADDKAFWMKVRDVISGSFRQDVFEATVSRMRAVAETEEIKKPMKAIEVVRSRYGLSDEEGEGLLAHLIKGGDLSQYGLLNAFTAHSQEISDYERATDFERFGGEVLELPKSDWSEIAKAA